MKKYTTHNCIALCTALTCAWLHPAQTQPAHTPYITKRFNSKIDSLATPEDKTKVVQAIFQELADLINCIDKDTLADMRVTAEIAVGELIDKITILEIKLEKIQDPAKRLNISTELESLMCTYDKFVINSPELELLTKELMAANRALWDIEDAIREKEAHQEFDEEFVKIARSVYYINDERCAAKRKINKLVGSRINEEKAYKDYCSKNLFNC